MKGDAMADYQLDKEDELLHFVSYTQSAMNMYATTEKQIRVRSVNQLVFPDDCTSFELFDKILRHHKDDTVYLGEIINRCQYYIGTPYTIAELIQHLGENHEIVEICKDMEVDRAVKVYGNEYIPLQPTDKVITPERVNTRSNSSNKAAMERLY